jgi:hypothetical protein
MSQDVLGKKSYQALIVRHILVHVRIRRVSERRSEETRILEVVMMLGFDLAGHVQHCRCRIRNLVLRLLVRSIVVRPFGHLVVRAVGEELHCLDRLVPVSGVPRATFVVFLECSTDEGFTDIGDTLVTQVVWDLEPVIFALVHTLAADKLQAFRVPCATSWR